MSNGKPYPSDVPDEVVDSLVSWALKHIPANVVARNVDGGKLAGAAPDFREPNLLLS